MPAMSRRNLVLEHREEIKRIAKSCNTDAIALIGSTARGEDTDESDCDFLADYNERTSLFDACEMGALLMDLLDCEVDIVSRRALPPRMAHVVNDALPL